MAWELLPVNYTDVSWSGLKKYVMVTNDDDTVSFQDVTQYQNRSNSFFGAKEANRMNEALNTLMNMVESGTNLYEAFQNYFSVQKGLFEDEADSTQESYKSYIEQLQADADKLISGIETTYTAEIEAFENQQEIVFKAWFDAIKDRLSQDQAGNLQNQIDEIDDMLDGFNDRDITFATDGKTVTEVYGEKKVVTTFDSDTLITQKLYDGDVLTKTKTITFTNNGTEIKEVVS